MNKKIVALFIAGAMVLATGCGAGTKAKSGSEESQKASDYVTLGKYKDLTVTLQNSYSTDDAAVREYEDTLISQQSGFDKDDTQDTVKKDSIVNVDYKGMKDGKAFDGGTADDQNIDVANNEDASSGSGYIEGFTDGLVGAKVGDTVDSKVTFPENYGSADLAGQEVTFEFKINYICKRATLDSVDDAFLKDNFDVDSKDAFYDYAKKKLEETNDYNKRSEVGSLVISEVEKSSKVNKYPSFVTKGDSGEQVLIFAAIAEKEKLSIKDSDYDSFVTSLMNQAGTTDEDTFYKSYGSTASAGKKYLKMIYKAQLGLKFCEDQASVKEK